MQICHYYNFFFLLFHARFLSRLLMGNVDKEIFAHELECFVWLLRRHNEMLTGDYYTEPTPRSLIRQTFVTNIRW